MLDCISVCNYEITERHDVDEGIGLMNERISLLENYVLALHQNPSTSFDFTKIHVRDEKIKVDMGGGWTTGFRVKKAVLNYEQTCTFFELLIEVIREWKEIAHHVIHETGRTTKRAIA